MGVLFYSSTKLAADNRRRRIEMEIGATTDVGLVRELNEDTILATALPPGIGNPWQLTSVLMVADGLGGHQAGEVASQMAGETVLQRFVLGQADSWVPDEVTPANVRQQITDVIRQVNELVHAQSAEAGGAARPATTLTLCLTRDGEYHIGHVGDTRAYLIRDEEITQITDDDSWVGDAVRRGQMTQDEAQSSPFRNQLLKTVGTAPTVEPTIYSGRLNVSDMLLLCSDGMTEYVVPSEMLHGSSCSPTLQVACDQLVALARERGGHDNISVVMASPRVHSAKTQKPPTLPRTTAPTWPPVKRPGLRKDPNRYLRNVLLALVGLAALFMGLWVGRRLPYHSAPRDVLGPVIVSPATVLYDNLSSVTNNRTDAHHSKGHSRRLHRHKVIQPGLAQPKPPE